MEVVGSTIVIVLIFATITVTNFMAAQLKAKIKVVKANMRLCQLAAEQYASDHEGRYPRSSTDVEFRSYYPGGQPPEVAGAPITNPFTGRVEWPVDGTISDIETSRKTKSSNVGMGIVEYSALLDTAGTPRDYAIRGGDNLGNAIPSITDPTLILSKDHQGADLLIRLQISQPQEQ